MCGVVFAFKRKIDMDGEARRKKKEKKKRKEQPNKAHKPMKVWDSQRNVVQKFKPLLFPVDNRKKNNGKNLCNEYFTVHILFPLFFLLPLTVGCCCA